MNPNLPKPFRSPRGLATQGRTRPPDEASLFRDLARSANYRIQPKRKTPPVTEAVIALGRKYGVCEVLARVESLVGWRQHMYPTAKIDEAPPVVNGIVWSKGDLIVWAKRECLKPEDLPPALLHLLRSLGRQTATRLPYVVDGFNRAVERGEFESALLDQRALLLPAPGGRTP